jgi:hypothetical protein
LKIEDSFSRALRFIKAAEPREKLKIENRELRYKKNKKVNIK